MKLSRPFLVAISASALTVACGSGTPEPSGPGAPPSASVARPAPPPPPASSSALVAPPPPELTPEEKKKAEDAKQLVADRAKQEADVKAELARWTPEMHTEAKALAEKAYPSLKAALDAVLKSKHRKPEHAARDKDRHPKETLAFFGLKPTMTVIEIGPGEGWYTELLAPIVAAKGKLFVTSGDPKGSIELRPTLYAQRTEQFLAKAPELYGKVDRLFMESTKPALGMEGKADLVLVSRAMHGWVQNKLTAAWLKEVHTALKAGGVLAVEAHRAKGDGDVEELAKKGYLPEAWVIKEIEAAGFKLAEKSEINANPKDTKDYEPGVWALPPTLRLGDKDKDKYLAIGESDRMTLRFVKLAPKKK